jgi:hypothetical protein
MFRAIKRWWTCVTRENHIHIVTYVEFDDMHYSTCFYELKDALEYAQRLEIKTGRTIHVTNAQLL